MQRPSLQRNYNPSLVVGNGVYTFPEHINLKVNVIGRLEIERAYYDITVQLEL